MTFDLDQKTVALSVGEFAGFYLGPRESGEGGAAGLWRAQLGTHWHNELRARATTEHATAALFEVPIHGRIFHHGWTFTLTGRIDQMVRGATGTTLREIKTVTRALPADETELRADYPEYFAQLACYAALARLGALGRTTEPDPGSSSGSCRDAQPARPRPGGPPVPTSTAGEMQAAPSWVPSSSLRAELVFVETGTGLTQTIALTSADDVLFRAQLERCTEFLTQRLRARERLRGLRFQPAFATPRPGQETTLAELTTHFERRPLVLFEAPTGFGKTGVLLEFALGQLRSGHFDRALYLTSKSTGQLQVVRTLQAMSQEIPAPSASTPVAAWHVRNKSEHCVNHTFHCVRDQCIYLADAASRWPQSGLARFYLDEKHARDLDTLRTAGREARICPYEITRTALAFNDVWIGDYNYVFAPRNRGLFFEQPGFAPARTLLLIDEAHNLPSRVADCYSHAFSAPAAFTVSEELQRLRPNAALVRAWDHWGHFLQHLRATDALAPEAEDDARHLMDEIANRLRSAPLDLGELGPHAADLLWSVPALLDDLAANGLPRLWWCPRDGELALTCLDAAPAIGAALHEFGGVVLASATLTPIDSFAAACGLDEETGYGAPEAGKPGRTKGVGVSGRRFPVSGLQTGADLLRVEEAFDASRPALLRAHTPWREGAYDVAFDARVDTTFQQRAQHYPTTAATIAALAAAAAPASGVAIFFPSYAYAEAIARELNSVAPGLRAALQPKLRNLAAQSAWVEESLLLADALFLVLGSSFAESIDTLGGRVTHAMVVGPALPEVNAVQRARLAEVSRAGLNREAAFRRVYQIPGMTKVNQALGRLVRAPGQRARVLLHCRRFLEPTYASLLAPEYQLGTNVHTDEELAQWLSPP